MSDRLCAFAKTGSPNLDGLAEWPDGGKLAMSFGDEESALRNPSRLKLWYTLFTNEAPGE